MGGYAVTVRVGARVARERFDDLESALDAIQSRGRELEGDAVAGARTIDPKLIGRFEPVQQVAARIELRGPGGLRAGVDVRGDGSSEAYTGRLRRRLIEQRRGESSYDALRRAVG
jgi:hypothetical protein